MARATFRSNRVEYAVGERFHPAEGEAVFLWRRNGTVVQIHSSDHLLLTIKHVWQLAVVRAGCIGLG